MTKEKKYIVKTVTDKKTGKRVYFYGKTQREVNQKMLNYKRKEERGRLFREVSDEWWEEAEKRLSLTSAVAYASAKRKVDEEFGNMPIRAIEPEHLEKYYSRLVAQGYSYGFIVENFRNPLKTQETQQYQRVSRIGLCCNMSVYPRLLRCKSVVQG